MKEITLAVAGSDTEAGKLFLEKLEENENIGIKELYPLEKVPDEYDAIRFRKKNYLTCKLDDFDFSQAQVAIFFCSEKNAMAPLEQAFEAGCFIINATEAVPTYGSLMVIPQVNSDQMLDVRSRCFTSPSGPVISSVLALKDIVDEFGIDYLNITAFESVSSFGHGAVQELAGQTVALLSGKPSVNKNFPAQVAFNVIPSVIGGEQIQQYSDYELQQVKDLENFLPALGGKVTYSSFTVPVFYGYCAHLTFRTAVSTSLEQVNDLLTHGSLNQFIESETVTPVTHGVNRTKQVITRLRNSTGCDDEFNMFVVLDNTLTGNVLNCMQILEKIIENML